ncbi:MAG: hypothetical protein D6705_08375 [Deltaproteobacteria bacterium]|nr:MAG: hypothetical protein D6705_08375 [Deltaproteobacteria bacterium]
MMRGMPTFVAHARTLARARGRAVAFVLGVAICASCALRPSRLPELDRRFYANLPSPDAQHAFLKMRKPEERRAYLESLGLWQKWEALSPEEQKAVLEGRVEVGFDEFALYMAWGPPADVRTERTKHRKVDFLTFIRCTSGPRTGAYVKSNLDCDGTSSETIVAVENGRVTEIRYPY